MTNNIWESDLVKEEDNNSFYLRINDGDTLILTWLDIEKHAQSDKTPAEYRTPDGNELLLTFNLDNVKKGFTCKSAKNKLLAAMKAASVQLGDTFEVKRTGIGAIDTQYVVTLMRDGQKIVRDEQGVEIPF